MSAVSSSTGSLAQTYAPVVYREGNKTVIEHNYDLPKGKHSNLVGSFSYRPQTTKAGQLRARLQAKKRKLGDLQMREKATLTSHGKKKRKLQCEIRYLENELAREVVKTPEVRINVREKDGSE